MKEAKQRDEDTKQAQIDADKKEKEQFIFDLVKKYNIKYEWDTLKYDYSINYLPVIESQYQLVNNFRINDIYEKEGDQFISIKTGYFPDDILFIYFLDKDDLEPCFSFDLKVTTEQMDRLNKTKDDFILVVNITDIIKKQPYLLKGAANGESMENIELVTMPEFIGNGKLIDVITLTKK